MGKVDVKKRIAPPLGLAYLAAYLEAHMKDLGIEILDTVIEGYEREESANEYSTNIGLSWNEIYAHIEACRPDLVGIYAGGTDQSENAHQLAGIVKSYDKRILTAMGAVYPTTEPERALSDENVDFIVLGEGEETFYKAIKALNDGGTLRDLSALQGICARDGDQVLMNKNYGFLQGIESLPFPARDKLRMNDYLYAPLSYRFGPKRKPHTSIITSRGCPARCIFCEAHLMVGRKYRENSPEKVLKEIDVLVNEYKVKELAFLDDNLTLDKKRTAGILDGLIARGYDLEWMTPNGVALYALDKDMIFKMKEAGCYQVNLAFESGNQHVLDKIIGKPLKLEKARQVARWCREAGMETIGMFVIGFPGETLLQMEETVRFAEEVDCDYVSFSLATPYPGSRLHEVCRERGDLVDGWYENLVFGFGKGCIKTHDFTPEDVLRVRKDAWKRINFENPSKRRTVEEFLSR